MSSRLWIFGVSILVLAVAGAGVIFLVGNESAESVNADVPGADAAMKCPQATPDGFKLSDIEGKKLPEVEQWAEEKGLTVRVVVEDGKPRAATMDYSPHRVNTQVDAGVVTRYCGNF
jgi:hypothetical protein